MSNEIGEQEILGRQRMGRIMNEVSYVVEGFERKFAPFKGQKILLHGSREYARAIVERYDPVFHFAGIMSFDPIDPLMFPGLPVIDQDDLPAFDPDLIILTERVKYAERAYCSLRRICKEVGIPIFNMYGLDEVWLHREAEKPVPESLEEWIEVCAPYDRVVFEVMDTSISFSVTGEDPMVKETIQQLIAHLRSEGKSLGFSLRKSFPEEPQIQALRTFGLVADEETELIRRKGEDYSFRALREAYPTEKILHIGTGLVKEFILPRCYGIDTLCTGGRWEVKCLAPEKAKPVPKPYQPDLRQQIEEKIKRHANISFDVFDTLLVRKTLYPQDVFYLTERRAKNAGFAADGFAEARQRVEHDHVYADLDQIYACLEDVFDWTEETAEQIKGIELSVEMDILSPRTEIVELLHFAKQEGKRVFLISDTYLPEPVLCDILAKNGITGFDVLLVSCAYKKAKQSGLYQELIALCPGSGSILHIGADPAADGMASETAGICSVVIPSALELARERGWETCISSARTLTERCMVGSVVSKLYRDPFQNPNLHERTEEERILRYGISAVAPLATGYMTWLLSKLRENEFDGVLFLARDGYLPAAIYDLVREDMHLPKGIYYYANRHSAFLCGADIETQVDSIAQLGRLQGLTAREILKNIYRIPEEDLLPLEKYDTVAEYIDKHMPVIREIAKGSREGFRRYSERCGMRPGGLYALVDFVPGGTTLPNLQRFLPYRMKGFYFGNFRSSMNDNEYYLIRKDSALIKNFIELESYFCSPEPSQDCMKEDGTPVFFEEIRTPQEMLQFQMVFDAALSFAGEFFRVFYQEGEIISPSLVEEAYAAEGYHWVQQAVYNDWLRVPIRTQGAG